MPNLRMFHIFFITASTLLLGAFAWWAFQDYKTFADGLIAFYGGLSAVGCIGLIFYGRWFLVRGRK